MWVMKFLENKMTSPKGMNEIFWGKDMEDVFNSIKKLQRLKRSKNWMKKNYSKLWNSTWKERPKIGAVNLILFHMTR